MANRPPQTYCNPLPLPSYPPGMFNHHRTDPNRSWWGDRSQDFRETGDPTVIYHDGAWYLFPSCGMAWKSEDFVNWTYHPTGPEKIGYAPTVVRYHDRFLMTAQTRYVWQAPHPLGPWEQLGPVRDEQGAPTDWWDPMLFVDDDGALYGYFFKGEANTGIYAVKMRDDDPTRFASAPVHCFAYDPAHLWERYGDQNQNPFESWIEGPWMNRIGGRYYLQYAACGAQWKNYAVGCYVGNHPLGPFHYQERNPILRHKNGLINGCGHHSLVEGPNGTLWCFYTVLVRIEHDFERRIGMDPAGFDADGFLFVAGPTETPQWAPGAIDRPERGNDAGLWNLSCGQKTTASSAAPGHPPVFATDDQIRTWWEAVADGPHWLQVDLSNDYTGDALRASQGFLVGGARTMFADRGLDYVHGVVPAPYCYRIEGSPDARNWVVLCDKTGSHPEQHIVYDTWEPQQMRYVRLVVESAPPGMRLGVWEFTVFGRAQ